MTKVSVTETFSSQTDMSRIGKKVIAVPAGVVVTLNEATNSVHVKGERGELSETLLPFVKVNINGAEITLDIANGKEKLQRAMWGTSRALVWNMIEGVSTGFTKQLELNGVGFRMEVAGKQLKLAIGFSHPVFVDIPDLVTVNIEKNVLTATSFNKQVLGHFVQYVHDLKSADPYKHKGFKYPGKFYPKKVGKKMSK